MFHCEHVETGTHSRTAIRDRSLRTIGPKAMEVRAQFGAIKQATVRPMQCNPRRAARTRHVTGTRIDQDLLAREALMRARVKYRATTCR